MFALLEIQFPKTGGIHCDAWIVISIEYPSSIKHSRKKKNTRPVFRLKDAPTSAYFSTGHHVHTFQSNIYHSQIMNKFSHMENCIIKESKSKVSNKTKSSVMFEKIKSQTISVPSLLSNMHNFCSRRDSGSEPIIYFCSTKWGTKMSHVDCRELWSNFDLVYTFLMQKEG